MNEVSDEELRGVIADFLEMGHVENIVSMFKKEPMYFDWTGELLRDERFNVRLGLTIVFEELKQLEMVQLERAIPSLRPLLADPSPLLRGEAVSILGIIGTGEAREIIQSMAEDSSEQVREMVEMSLADEEI